jgi:hypothetical protein
MASKQVTLYAPIVRTAISGATPRKGELEQAVAKDARNRTGIFFPEKYVPGPNLDLIIYFHGLLDRCGGSASDTIEKYWTNPYFRLREMVNDSGKNVVLVAPRVVESDKTGSKLRMDGNDFLKKVQEVIADRLQTEPFTYTGKVQIRNIVLAAHSGGGTTMLRLAQTATVGKVCECWGFDSFYYPNVQEWVDWAAPGGKFFLFWHDEENTGDNARKFQQLLTLKANATAANNVFVKNTANASTIFPATTSDHCAVPKTYFPDLLTRKGNCLS